MIIMKTVKEGDEGKERREASEKEANEGRITRNKSLSSLRRSQCHHTKSNKLVSSKGGKGREGKGREGKGREGKGGAPHSTGVESRMRSWPVVLWRLVNEGQWQVFFPHFTSWPIV